MDQLELACPFCTGRIQATAATESRVMACPHCARQVTVPASPLDLTTSLATRDFAPSSPNCLAEPAETVSNFRGEPTPLRRLSPQEKARIRRRLHLALAVICMTLLAITLLVLVRLRP